MRLVALDASDIETLNVLVENSLLSDFASSTRRETKVDVALRLPRRRCLGVFSDSRRRGPRI
jgi:hypothetical protein